MATVFFSKTDSLGDQILATGVVSALRHAFPENHAVWAVRHGYQHIAALIPGARVFQADTSTSPTAEVKRLRKTAGNGARETLVILPVPVNPYAAESFSPEGAQRFVWWAEFLRELHPEVAICGTASTNWLDQALVFAGQGSCRIGPEYQWGCQHVPFSIASKIGLADEAQCFTQTVPIDPNSPERSRLEALVRPVIGEAEIPLPALALPETVDLPDLPEAFVAVASGCGDLRRAWSPEGFAEFANRMEPEAAIVLVEGPADREAVDAAELVFRQRCAGRDVLRVQLAPEQLDVLLGIVSAARLLLCNDTALVHVAACTETPTVGVFGGGYKGRFLPRMGKVTSVVLPMPCFGCRWECCFEDFMCIRDITAEALLAALEDADDWRTRDATVLELPSPRSEEDVLAALTQSLQGRLQFVTDDSFARLWQLERAQESQSRLRQNLAAAQTLAVSLSSELSGDEPPLPEVLARQVNELRQSLAHTLREVTGALARSDQIDEHTEALQRCRSAILENLGGLNENLNSLHRHIGNHVASQGQVERQTHEIRQTRSELIGGLTEIGKGLQRLEGHLDQALAAGAERFEALGDLTGRLTDAESRAAQLREQLEAEQSRGREAEEERAALQAETSRLEGELQAEAQRGERLQHRLGTALRKVGTLATRGATLQRTRQALDAVRGELAGAVAEVREQVAGLAESWEADGGSAREDLASAREQIGSLTTQLQDSEQALEQRAAALAEMRDELQAEHDRTERLVDEVATLQGRVGEVAAGVQNSGRILEEDLREARDKAARLSASLGKAEASLLAREKQVEALAADLEKERGRGNALVKQLGQIAEDFTNHDRYERRRDAKLMERLAGLSRDLQAARDEGKATADRTGKSFDHVLQGQDQATAKLRELDEKLERQDRDERDRDTALDQKIDGIGAGLQAGREENSAAVQRTGETLAELLQRQEQAAEGFGALSDQLGKRDSEQRRRGAQLAERLANLNRDLQAARDEGKATADRTGKSFDQVLQGQDQATAELRELDEKLERQDRDERDRDTVLDQKIDGIGAGLQAGREENSAAVQQTGETLAELLQRQEQAAEGFGALSDQLGKRDSEQRRRGAQLAERLADLNRDLQAARDEGKATADRTGKSFDQVLKEQQQTAEEIRSLGGELAEKDREERERDAALAEALTGLGVGVAEQHSRTRSELIETGKDLAEEVRSQGHQASEGLSQLADDLQRLGHEIQKRTEEGRQATDDQLERLHRAGDALSTVVHALRSEHDFAHGETRDAIEALGVRWDDARDQLAQELLERVTLERQLQETADSLQESQGRGVELQQRLDKARTEQDALEAILGTERDQRRQIEATRDHLATALTRSRERLAEREDAVHTVTDRLHRTTTELTEQCENSARLESLLHSEQAARERDATVRNDLKIKTQHLDLARQQALSRCDSLAETIQNTAVTLCQLRGELAAAKRAEADNKGALTMQQEEIDALSQQIEQLHQQKLEQEAEVQRLSTEIQKSLCRLHYMERRLAVEDRTRQELEEMHGALARSHGLLTEALEDFRGRRGYRLLSRFGRWQEVDRALVEALSQAGQVTRGPSSNGRPRLRTIAVDMTPTRPGGDIGGAKILAYELVRHLAQLHRDIQYVLLANSVNIEELGQFACENVTVFDVTAHNQLGLNELVVGEVGADLLFCPFTAPFYHTPEVPCVTLILDLQSLYYSQFFSPEERAERERNFRTAVALSSAAVCISEFVRGTVLEKSDMAPATVTAIHIQTPHRLPEVSEDEANAVLGTLGLARENYLLFPANFWLHKNHRMLVTAFGQWCGRRPDNELKLVFTGSPHRNEELLRDAVSAMGLAGRVVFAGHRPEPEFAVLMRNCLAVIFPSLYEGFGMPVLEAMSCDRPVLCSDVTSLPEVVGDAAIQFDPRRPERIVDAIERIVDDVDLREQLRTRGKERVTCFANPRRMAEQYFEVLEREFQRPRGFDHGIRGFYADGCMANSCVITFPAGQADRCLELEVAPILPDLQNRSMIEVQRGGGARTECHHLNLNGGPDTLRVPLPHQAGFLRILTSPSFVPQDLGLGADVRRVALRCVSCRITQGDTVRNLFPEATT